MRVFPGWSILFKDQTFWSFEQWKETVGDCRFCDMGQMAQLKFFFFFWGGVHPTRNLDRPAGVPIHSRVGFTTKGNLMQESSQNDLILLSSWRILRYIPGGDRRISWTINNRTWPNIVSGSWITLLWALPAPPSLLKWFDFSVFPSLVVQTSESSEKVRVHKCFGTHPASQNTKTKQHKTNQGTQTRTHQTIENKTHRPNQNKPTKTNKEHQPNNLTHAKENKTQKTNKTKHTDQTKPP